VTDDLTGEHVDEPVGAVEAARMPLMEHLKELRDRVVIAGVTLGIGMTVSFFFAEQIFALLTAPIRQILEGSPEYPSIDAFYAALSSPVTSMMPQQKLEGALAITGNPFEGMYTVLRVALIGGVVLAFPVIAYQTWRFVAPGLHNSERKHVFPLALASTLLFVLGLGFAYALILPVALPFLLQIISADLRPSIYQYLNSVMRMLLAFGGCFQLPIAVYFMARIGLVDHTDMIKGFRYSVVGIFVIAAIITPPDIITQVLLGLPLILLYGVGVGVARVFSTKVRLAS